jgi:tRNA modification GTPase
VAEEKAIVTPMPGTTRDLIEDTIHVKGIKVRLVDSAGIRDPKDMVEEEGIERVKKRIPQADLILWVLDGSERFTPEDGSIGELLSDKEVLAVINKVDLPIQLDRSALPAGIKRIVEVSCKDETGHEELKARIYRSFQRKGGRTGKVIITNLRHRDALVKAQQGIDRALDGSTGGLPLEVVAFELREALFHLGEITGETCADEVLNTIFDRFCIGK